jgi:hypothetical protein
MRERRSHDAAAGCLYIIALADSFSDPLCIAAFIRSRLGKHSTHLNCCDMRSRTPWNPQVKDWHCAQQPSAVPRLALLCLSRTGTRELQA